MNQPLEAWALNAFLENDYVKVVNRLSTEKTLSAKCRLILGVCYRRLEKNEQAMACFETIVRTQLADLQAENQLDVLDGLTVCHQMAGNLPQAIHYGRQAIEQRSLVFSAPKCAWVDSQQWRPLSELPLTTLMQGKKVISYSLYGALAVYIEMLLINLAAVKVLFPEWEVWVYHDHTVPESALTRLQAASVVLKPVGDADKKYPATMWRFFAVEDPQVTWVMFRDADSYVTPREQACVKAWLASQQPAHAMRDWYSHTEVLLAGMWGAYAPYFRTLRVAMDHFVGRAFTPSHGDQHFLRRYVWPVVQKSVCVHDSLFGTPAQRYPTGEAPTLGAHVGNRLSNHFFLPRPPNFPVQTMQPPMLRFSAHQTLVCEYPLLRETQQPAPGWLIEIPNLYRDLVRSGQMVLDVRPGV